MGAEFVWIPAGKFVMGSPAHEAGRYAHEVQREVTLTTGYWMGKREVTQGQWEAVMGATGIAPFPGETVNRTWPWLCVPECAATGMNWIEIQRFIRTLNSRESGSGYEYRLPTEAEWEYAARAGTTGPRYGELDAIAWHGGNQGD